VSEAPNEKLFFVDTGSKEKGTDGSCGTGLCLVGTSPSHPLGITDVQLHRKICVAGFGGAHL
jgi:hypothetical protein